MGILWQCDTMGSIRFCLCGCRSENPFVCFGAKRTRRAWRRDPPRDRKWRREGRSQRRQSQLTKEDWKGQSTEGSKKDRSTEQGRQTRNESEFLAALWKFRVKYTPARGCKCTDNCTKVPQTPSSCKSVFFLSSTLSVVFCVSIKKCVMLLVRDDKKNKQQNNNN